MSVHENDFFPGLDVAEAYRAQRRELAAQGQAILDLLDRLKALEARLDGQGRDGTE